MRTAITSVLSLVLLFTLVKKPENYLKYALLLFLTMLFAKFWLSSGVKSKAIALVKPDFSRVKEYFSDIIKLFALI